MSLKEKQDKLAFSLSFEINPKGLIDFRTVDFFKSVINVQENLTHEELKRNKEIFPEIFQLNELMDSVGLVDSSYIL